MVCGHHGYCLWPSWFVAIMVIIFGRRGLWPSWLLFVAIMVCGHHGHYFWPSWFVAIMVEAIMVCGRRCQTPLHVVLLIVPSVLRYNVFALFVCMSVHLCVRPSVHVSRTLRQYLAKHLRDNQTHTSDALWDRGELVTFVGQKVKG